MLQQQGLDLGTVSGTVNAGTASSALITGQDPAAGATVARGARVNVSVPFRCVGVVGIRPCIELEDRITDIGVIKKLDPTIKQPLILRKVE
jgi:hypothetical protein